MLSECVTWKDESTFAVSAATDIAFSGEYTGIFLEVHNIPGTWVASWLVLWVPRFLIW